MHDVELSAPDPEKQPVTGGGQAASAEEDGSVEPKVPEEEVAHSTGSRSAGGGRRQLRGEIIFDFCQCGLTISPLFRWARTRLMLLLLLSPP